MHLQLLFYFLKQYKLIYAGILVLTLCASVLESLSLVAFLPVFSAILEDPGTEQGGIVAPITRIVGLMPFSDLIVSACVLLIGIFFLKTAFTLIREALTAYACGKVLYNVKNEIMDKYAGAQYQFFLDTKQGSLIFNSITAPGNVATLLLKVPQMVAELLRILAIIVVLFFVSTYTTLAIVALGLVYYGAIHHISKKVSYTLGKGRADAATQQTVIANEFLNGIRQIIAFRTAKGWLRRFERENRIFSELYAKGLVWITMPRSLMEFTTVVLMLGLLLILWLFSADTFTAALPKLGIFAIALVRLLPSVTSFGRIRMEMMGSLPQAELAYQSITASIPRRNDGTRDLDSFKKAIIFEDVSFTYQGRDTLLKRVNLAFEKGKVTAIVGPSGAGKTTIINLILGLFEPTNGRITVDGVHMGDYKQDAWLSKIGFVSQEAFIYHSTIAKNISFGRNGHSMDSIVKAATIANAQGFISELPQGYDTLVGERGMKLSGGQQQRIAIARAVLDEPELLIFDEATSSLDTVSERLVQEAIDNVSKNRTVIIIAHRLSTISYADKIIVLDNGLVSEEGTHHELLRNQGHYSRLVASSR